MYEHVLTAVRYRELASHLTILYVIRRETTQPGQVQYTVRTPTRPYDVREVDCAKSETAKLRVQTSIGPSHFWR